MSDADIVQENNENNLAVDKRRTLKDWEPRNCPHCGKSSKNFSSLISHSKSVHHLEDKNLCTFCKAPFGANGGKLRNVHEAAAHPADSGWRVQKKQKKSDSGGGKGTGGKAKGGGKAKC